MAELQFVKVCECGCGRPTTIADRTRPTTGVVKGQPRRFSRGHNSPPVVDRFWARVNKTQTCWLWTGVIDAGYGRFYTGITTGRVAYSHRFAYELLVGPIPNGLVLDHLCRNRACCNPAHLEPVTDDENFRRGAGSSGVLYEPPTRCQRGHDISTPDGYYVVRVRGRVTQRACKKCRAQHQRDYRARKRAANRAPGELPEVERP